MSSQSRLKKAVETNNLEEVENLIKDGVELGEILPDQDQPLHICCVKQNSLEVLDLLLENGADVESRDANGQTPLVMAANAGRVEIVEYLLEVRHADVNASDASSKTALHIATRRQCQSTTELLCKHGAITDAQDGKGITPLCYSAFFGALEVASTLLRAGADPNISDNAGNSPLHYASRHDHVEIVVLLIKNSANVDAQSDKGYTPLFWAVSFYHIEIADILLESGASVYLANDRGKTPLFKAITQHQEELAYKLVVKHLDVDVTDATNTTPLHLCVLKGLYRPFQLLIGKQADVNIKAEKYGTPLNVAAVNNKPKYLIPLLTCCQGVFSEFESPYQWLIGNEIFAYNITVYLDPIKVARLNFCSWNKECMMTIMAYWGNKKAADYLINKFLYGTPECEKVSPFSLFHSLAYTGEVSLLTKFIDSGGDIEFKGGYRGATLLLESVIGANSRATKLLYNYGANIKATNFDGETAMHISCATLCVRMVRMLLKMGFEPDRKNNKRNGGLTPLALALSSTSSRLSKLKIRKAKEKITRMLLDAGADPNVRVNGNRDCPMTIAITPPCGNRLPRVLRYLLKAGAHPTFESFRYNDETNTYWSPLQLAVFKNDVTCATELLKAGAHPRKHILELDIGAWTPSPISLAMTMNYSEIYHLFLRYELKQQLHGN